MSRLIRGEVDGKRVWIESHPGDGKVVARKGEHDPGGLMSYKELILPSDVALSQLNIRKSPAVRVNPHRFSGSSTTINV